MTFARLKLIDNLLLQHEPDRLWIDFLLFIDQSVTMHVMLTRSWYPSMVRIPWTAARAIRCWIKEARRGLSITNWAENIEQPVNNEDWKAILRVEFSTGDRNKEGNLLNVSGHLNWAVGGGPQIFRIDYRKIAATITCKYLNNNEPPSISFWQRTSIS